MRLSVLLVLLSACGNQSVERQRSGNIPNSGENAKEGSQLLHVYKGPMEKYSLVSEQASAADPFSCDSAEKGVGLYLSNYNTGCSEHASCWVEKSKVSTVVNGAKPDGVESAIASSVFMDGMVDGDYFGFPGYLVQCTKEDKIKLQPRPRVVCTNQTAKVYAGLFGTACEGFSTCWALKTDFTENRSSKGLVDAAQFGFPDWLVQCTSDSSVQLGITAGERE